jgi:hypothetical protein
MLLLSELVAVVLLGWMAFASFEPGRPALASASPDSSCTGNPVVRPANMLIVQASTTRLLEAQPEQEDPRLGEILASVTWDAQLHLDLEQALYLAGDRTEEEHAASIRRSRKVLVTTLTPLLGERRAAAYGQELFDDWRAAWTQVERDLNQRVTVIGASPASARSEPPGATR